MERERAEADLRDAVEAVIFGVLRQVGAFPLADMSATAKAGTCPSSPKVES